MFSKLCNNALYMFHFRQNIPGDMGSEELSTCLFDPKHPRSKHCPFFKVNTIVEETGNSFRSIVVEVSFSSSFFVSFLNRMSWKHHSTAKRFLAVASTHVLAS